METLSCSLISKVTSELSSCINPTIRLTGQPATCTTDRAMRGLLYNTNWIQPEGPPIKQIGCSQAGQTIQFHSIDDNKYKNATFYHCTIYE